MRALVIAALLFTGCATERAADRPERAPAPDFSVVGLDGVTVSLRALRGKVVLVDFWATWCEPCREETPTLVALQKSKGATGLQLVAFSMDDEDAPVRSFVREQGVNYAVAMADAELGRAFGGVLGVPVKVLIDRHGRVVARHDGAVALDVLVREVDALLAE